MLGITYETLLGIHITAFVLNVSLVILADFLGLLWLSGKKKVLPKGFLYSAHYLIWAGLVVSIISGYFLFAGTSEYLLTVTAFYTKMFFVLALMVNSFVIHRHIKIVTTVPFSETLNKERKKLILSGGVSFISWVGVLVSAQFLGL